MSHSLCVGIYMHTYIRRTFFLMNRSLVSKNIYKVCVIVRGIEFLMCLGGSLTKLLKKDFLHVVIYSNIFFPYAACNKTRKKGKKNHTLLYSVANVMN